MICGGCLRGFSSKKRFTKSGTSSTTGQHGSRFQCAACSVMTVEFSRGKAQGDVGAPWAARVLLVAYPADCYRRLISFDPSGMRCDKLFRLLRARSLQPADIVKTSMKF